MSQLTTPLTLENFLSLPETKPASEFINGAIVQKPMPQGEHSRLQGKLCAEINRVAEPKKLACAFPELRCVFGGDAIVPDIAVFRWERIPRTGSGRVANRFDAAPDWAIEILVHEQDRHRAIGNLIYCLQYGAELAWLIDSQSESVITVTPPQSFQLLQGDCPLPVLSQIELSLTANQVFDWLAID